MTTRRRANQVTFAVCAAAVLILGGLVAYSVSMNDPAEAEEVPELVLREDSHRLETATEGDVTLVEFLDFECEACGAAYPVIEDLRERYADRVTFVLRYFPLDGHANARNAAHAVESAARQGQLEPMYQRMFATQAQWGEQSESKAALFRTYAQDLGLDMAKYDADVSSESVARRVQADVDDALALGFSGTPTFFLDGRPFSPTSVEDFTRALDAALTK